MHSVLNDPDLLAGFDDPDVMAAVTDIAVDPRRAVKYQDNPKVMCLWTLLVGLCVISQAVCEAMMVPYYDVYKACKCAVHAI